MWQLFNDTKHTVDAQTQSPVLQSFYQEPIFARCVKNIHGSSQLNGQAATFAGEQIAMNLSVASMKLKGDSQHTAHSPREVSR